MLEVLEKINFPTPTSMKRSGDIRMWIYIESRTSGECVSLVLHPSLTAGEAAKVAGEEANLPAGAQLEKMQVHEVVLAGALERPLHHAEQLLDVTLRWGSWPESDRHDNYLLLKTNQFYQEALPCALPPLSVFAEVQFSDNRGPKSKFTPFLFSVSKAAITYYRFSHCLCTLKVLCLQTPSITGRRKLGFQRNLELGRWRRRVGIWVVSQREAHLTTSTSPSSQRMRR